MIENKIMVDLEKKMNKFIDKKVIVIQDGFVQNRLIIQNLKYCLKGQILNITDNESSNYIKFNLNQVYRIENDEEKMKFYLDNDLNISIKR